jgi:hypothetical protein
MFYWMQCEAHRVFDMRYTKNKVIIIIIITSGCVIYSANHDPNHASGKQLNLFCPVTPLFITLRFSTGG